MYVDGGLWRSFDGYAASPGDLVLVLDLDGEGPHALELRNRPEHHPDSTGCTLRFKQLVVADREYNLRTIQYDYDALARLTETRYNPGIRTNAPDVDLLRRYQYGFDLAGNRLSESVAVAGGTPTVVNYTYNAANQITSGGVSYDADGYLSYDGTHTYTWDRAGRLLSMGGHSYTYDGSGVRVSQTVSSIVTEYLHDLQPGLPVMLTQTTGGSTDHFVHLPGQGILAQQDNTGDWTWPLADGLRSVRSVVNDDLSVGSVESYAPFGTPLEPGSFGSPFTYTGEPLDANGLVYLRARYYSPELGVFPSLDPVEGNAQQAMSLNRYMYVQGDPINFADQSGNNPNRNEMEKMDKFRYSCNCGWLDAAHVDFGVPAAFDGLVNFDINWSLFPPQVSRNRLRVIDPTNIHATGVGIGFLNAVIDENHADFKTQDGRNRIAVGIWMEAQKVLEQEQGQGFVSLVSSTSFSIEDLVSDLVGYAAHRAGQQWDTPGGGRLGELLGRIDYSNTWQNQWLKQECVLLDKPQSLDMYDRFEQGGGFPKNCNWEPLPLPSSVQNPYCTNNVTTGFQNSDMPQLTRTAIPSSSPGAGVWWWWEPRVHAAFRDRVVFVDPNAGTWDTISDHLYYIYKIPEQWNLPRIPEC